MEIFKVAFIGHRKLERAEILELKIKRIVYQFITSKEYVEFYVGDNGEFDSLVASSVLEMQKICERGNSRLIRVLPYPMKRGLSQEEEYREVRYPLEKGTHYKSAIGKRNEWLIDNCDLLVVHAYQAGGAMDAWNYASRHKVPVQPIFSIEE